MNRRSYLSLARLAAAVAGVAAIAGVGSAGADAQKVTFDPQRSQVEFVLDSPFHTVHGSFHLLSGEVTFDPTTGAASGTIVVDATSGESGNRSRDAKMHREVLESPRFPQIVLAAQRLEGSVPEEGSGSLKLYGTLTLHGVAHPVVLPATLKRHGDHVWATTRLTVPFIAWGLKDPSLMLIKVDREVEVTVRAEGTLAAAPERGR